jgi:hypothetical protein
MINQKDVINVKEVLDKLQEALEIADENGLFKNGSIQYFTILNYIMDGLRNLSQNPPNVIDARRNFSLAYFNFNRAVNSSSARWQFKYSHGGHIAIYLVALVIAPILACIFYGSILLQLELLWVPSWAYLWGLVGGALQGLWWLWQHVSDRKLRKIWLVWFFLLPITGAILGALTYLIFITGFIAATNQTRLGSPYFPILLSALAGFSSRWAVQLLDKLTTIIRVG